MQAPACREASLGFAIFWASAALALLAMAPFAGRIAALPIECPLHAATGIPCPACGSLRAAAQLAQLDLGAAVAASPIAALAWIGLVAGGLAAAIMTAAGRVVREPGSSLGLPGRAAIMLAVLANWAYLILRDA